jgi:excisionase family DNA binding protein
MDKLLTVTEAAIRAGVSESLVYQWIDERRLSHYRLGGKGKRGKIGISPSDLEAFIEGLKVEPLQEPDEAGYRRHVR